jgi:general secretion pathway protein G
LCTLSIDDKIEDFWAPDRYLAFDHDRLSFSEAAAYGSGAARAQIEMIGAALDAYRLDLGRYPTTEEGLAALTQRPAGTNSALWRGPYLRRAVPRDPWSHPYVYTSPGVASQAGYDLASYGADGAPGGTADAADITSWKE